MTWKTVRSWIFRRKTLYWSLGSLLAGWIGLHVFSQQILKIGVWRNNFALMELGVLFGADPQKSDWDHLWVYLFGNPWVICADPFYDPHDYPFNEPLLSNAFNKKNNYMIRWLLDHGADPNQKDGSGSILYYAVGRSDMQLVNILISRGADIHYRNPMGYSILNAAAHSINSLKYILSLDSSLDIHAITVEGKTLLHTSAGPKTEPEVFDFLVASGLDINGKDFRGYTPLDHALAVPYRSDGSDNSSVFLGNFENAEKLVSLGAKVEERHIKILVEDAKRRRPLDNTPILKELVRKNQEQTPKPEVGTTESEAKK